MNTKRWVCHISGQGEKWEVEREDNYTWMATNKRIVCHFPKSEYRLCDPPEEWDDITGECTWSQDSYHEHYIKAANGDRMEAYANGPYRVRKVQLWDCPFGIDGINRREQWAFIIERRKS